MNNEVPRGGIATPQTPDAAPPISDSPTPATAHVPASEPVRAQPPFFPVAHAPGAPYYPYTPAPPQAPRSGGHRGIWILSGILGLLLLGALATVLVAVLIGGLLAAVGQIEQTAVTTKTFTVSGMPSLVVSDAAGNVTVQPGSGNQVTIEVTKHAWAGSTAVAQRGLANVAVSTTQSGDVINVTAQFTTNVFDGGMTRRSVDLLITAPPRMNVDMNLGAGNIDSKQISGAIKLVTGAGNLTVSGISFERSSLLNTGAGNITGDCVLASAANVDMRIGAGNLTLTMPVDTPAHLVASTGVGNMNITGWSMPMTGTGVGHHTSGDMKPHPTAMLTIQIGAGNLTMMSR